MLLTTFYESKIKQQSIYRGTQKKFENITAYERNFWIRHINVFRSTKYEEMNIHFQKHVMKGVWYEYVLLLTYTDTEYSDILVTVAGNGYKIISSCFIQFLKK